MHAFPSVNRSLLAIVLVAVIPGLVYAGRHVSDPVLIQMEQGYGVVAAAIEEAVIIRPKGLKLSPTCYTLRFKVQEVLAKPVAGDALPVKAGTTFDLWLSVGDACLVEEWGGNVEKAAMKGGPLEVGKKYVLTIKYSKIGRDYAHAPGASAAKEVKTITPRDRAYRAEARKPKHDWSTEAAISDLEKILLQLKRHRTER